MHGMQIHEAPHTHTLTLTHTHTHTCTHTPIPPTQYSDCTTEKLPAWFYSGGIRSQPQVHATYVDT